MAIVGVDRFEVWRKFMRGRWWQFDTDYPRFIQLVPEMFHPDVAAGPVGARACVARHKRERLAAKTRLLIRLDRAERKHFASATD